MASEHHRCADSVPYLECSEVVDSAGLAKPPLSESERGDVLLNDGWYLGKALQSLAQMASDQRGQRRARHDLTRLAIYGGRESETDSRQFAHVGVKLQYCGVKDCADDPFGGRPRGNLVSVGTEDVACGVDYSSDYSSRLDVDGTAESGVASEPQWRTRFTYPVGGWARLAFFEPARGEERFDDGANCRPGDVGDSGEVGS
jgi:hypothetical protein